MERAEANWDRLVRAALRGDRLGGAYGLPASGIAGNVPSSLGNNVHIEEVLRAADEIQDEDPTIARILCEHAYTLAQSLDPNSEGRGVLQFKTGLMSVIRQKLAIREGGAIDRNQDIAKLQEFYKLYREKHKVDELCEDEMKLRESAVFSGNLGELERKTLKRKKVLATLKVLWSVIEDLTREISPEDAEKLISEEMKKVMQKDAARTEDVVAYNIIPLDALSTTNAIVTFPEVRAAISALQYHRDLPRLPETFSVPDAKKMSRADEIEDEETLAALLEASRTPQGRAALSDALADTLHLLPASPDRLLLLRLRLLRNLLAGDTLNQDTFILLSGPAAVTSSALAFPSLNPDVARAALQALGNAVLAGEHHRAAIWDALFPRALRELAGVRNTGVMDPLCMVLDTCCSGEVGRNRLEELCHEELGLPVLVEVITTASRVGHKEEWLEWLVFKICVEEQKFEILFAALYSSNDVEHSDGGESRTEFNAKHAFLLGALSKCLTNRPKEVNVSDSFALHVFNVQKHAAETVDFTRRGSSPLPTGCPAIDVLGYSLVLLKDICAWESASSEIQVPVDSLLQTGLVKRLLKHLAELEPPSTIRKSMARGQGDLPSLATAKVCPYIGYRRDLVAVIANCLHGRKQVQDEIRQLNGIMLLLQQCVVDEENPYLREWGLLAVKNILEGNVENQKEVSELQMQEPVITPEIADIGLRVEIDKETGHPKLVNTS